MSGKRKRLNSLNGYTTSAYWTNPNYNIELIACIEQELITLALNRFIWEGLPETCNPVILERTLLYNGMASIAPDNNGVIFSLPVGAVKEWNVYNEPTQWQVLGIRGGYQYDADNETGVCVYDNNTRRSIWKRLELCARQIADSVQTLNIQRSQQRIPLIITGTREQRQQLAEYSKQLVGYNSCVITDESFNPAIKLDAKQFQGQMDINGLWVDRKNAYSEAYTILGIQHLALEKKERMIQEEAVGNGSIAGIYAMNYLKSREKACNEINERLGLNVSVRWNTESLTYSGYLDEQHQQQIRDDQGRSVKDDNAFVD